jgi:hypothetical protein
MMSRNIKFMKWFSPCLIATSFLSWSAPASAATLTLTDWTTLPFPSGASHADTYLFPSFDFPLSTANPITRIEMDYRNVPLFNSSPGDHEIKSAQFLFNSGDLATTTVLESTADKFWVSILFKTIPDRRLTGLSNPSAPAFVAFHGSPNTFTSAQWTVTYQDGTIRTSNGGIIPEPGTPAWIAVFATLALCTRRMKRPRESARP